MEVHGAQYEFTAPQNTVIGVLSKRMAWVAYFLIALGVLAVLGGLVTLADGGVSAVIQGPLMVIIGIWTKKAAQAFDNVVKTEGSDISNLMAALGELRKLYTLQYWVIMIALVVVGLAIVVGVFAAL